MTIAEETIKTTAPSSLERQLQAQTALCNKLMASDRMWAATVDTLPDAVYMFSSDKRLTRINRAGEALEEAARSFLIARRCCDMLWGLEGSECMVDRALANGKPVEVETEIDVSFTLSKVSFLSVNTNLG